MIRYDFLLVLVLGSSLPLQGQVTELWATKGPEDHPFGTVMGVFEASPDQIWVLDALRPYHVHVLDGNGSFIRRTVRHGQGPGELRKISSGAKAPDGMALSDAHHIHFLDHQGQYRYKVRFPHQVFNQKDLEVTDQYYVLSAGMSIPGGSYDVTHEHSIFAFDRETGELVRSFHPSNPTPGLSGRYQSGAMLDIQGRSVIAVTTAPVEIVEYDLETGERLRTIAPVDTTLVDHLGEDFKFQLPGNRRTIFFRWWYPRVFYVERLDPDRLLVVTRFTRKDYGTDEDRSVWDVYDLQSGRRISRTESSRAYEVFDRTASGDFLATYTNQWDENVVVKLRFGSVR